MPTPEPTSRPVLEPGEQNRFRQPRSAVRNRKPHLQLLELLVSLRRPREWSLRGLLIGLMVPVGMTTLNMSMFGVALPAIRDAFQVQADTTAWIVTGYSLPFVVFTPMYGRLGDMVGKDKLFRIGIALFLVGSLICLLASNLAMLILGRALQGVGTAGVNPLAIAIISELFPADEQGKAMGTWSSTAPAASMAGPLLGGFVVDHVGWNAIFLLSLTAALIALYVVYRQLPSLAPPDNGLDLAQMDWIGAGLLGGTLVATMFYLSSRTVTGVPPLQDWRLLGLALGLGLAFWHWEHRTAAPMVDFALFQRRNFAPASIAAGLRMFIMGSANFLRALFLADIYGLGGTGLGVVATFYAGSILATTRLGGQLSDRVHPRWIVATSTGIQVVTLAGLALLPTGAPVHLAAGLMWGQAMGAGLALAALHRIAMEDVPPEEKGTAAGLYSTLRFSGAVVGATLTGVALHQAQQWAPSLMDAYQWVYGAIAVLGSGGFLVAWRMQR